eukprot:gene14406-17036_t
MVSENLGEVFDMSGNYARAVEGMNKSSFREAAALFAQCYIHALRAVESLPAGHATPDKVKNVQDVMYDCLVYRGACLAAMQSTSTAVESRSNLARAVEIAQRMSDAPRELKALDLLGAAEGRLHQHQSRLEVAERILLLSMDETSTTCQTTALVHKGAALNGLGRFKEAVLALQAAQEAARTASDASADVLAASHLTHAFLQLGQVNEARECATRALDLAQARNLGDGRVATALESLAEVCLEAGEATEAAECCARAMLEGSKGNRLRVGDGSGLLLRARAFSQRADWATAESQLSSALQVAESTGDENLGMRVLLAASCVHAGKGEAQEAAACLQKVAEVPVLEPVAIYSAIMEATKHPTVSSILPMTAWLIVRELDPDNSVLVVGNELAHADLTPSVRKGMELVHTDYQHRYFENLPIRELED